MCSVAILVRSIRGARNKVLAIDDARAVGLIRRNPPIEIANGGDAAVNDCHSDTRAIQTPLPPGRWRINCFGSEVVRRNRSAAERTIGRDVGYVGSVGRCLQRSYWDGIMGSFDRI